MLVTPEGLRSMKEFSINGSCETMMLFRPAGAEKDRLFLVTRKFHAMILEVEVGPNGKDFEIVTKAYGDVRDKIGKKSETGTIAVIDPESRVIGLRLYDSLFKVIPLERQISFQIKKKVEQTFDIRSPKDWHRGLRASSATSATSSTASPSSECSDDSEKGQKRLQIVESPTSSSPASPASGGEAAIAKPPSVLPLPTPIPSTGPPVPLGVPPPQILKGLPLPHSSPSLLPSPQPSQPQKPASSHTASTSSQLHGHPSRPLRPSLPTGLPPAEQPKWKSQPRLTQPPPLAHPPPGLPPVGIPPGPIARPPFRPQHPQQFQHR